MPRRNTISRTAVAAVSGVLVMGGMISLSKAFPAHIMAFFVQPAATITSIFLGAPLLRTDEGFLIEASRPFLIVAECSGVLFFSVLLSLLVFLAVKSVPLRTLAVSLPIIIAASYCITILANAMRLIGGWYVGTMLSAHSASSAVSRVAHEWTGMLVFIPILITVYYLAERRLCDETQSAKAAYKTPKKSRA